MPRSQVALTIWGRTYRRALRRGCDHGYAAYLADRAEKRATDSAPAAHVHTDKCWEPDSGCDMGRNEAFVTTATVDAAQK